MLERQGLKVPMKDKQEPLSHAVENRQIVNILGTPGHIESVLFVSLWPLKNVKIIFKAGTYKTGLVVCQIW